VEAPAQFGVYFAVLRKHLLLLGVSAALVTGAGVFYVVRQKPVFLSSATLLIDHPTRNMVGGREYAELLAADDAELSTQIFLLKQNRELARQAIEKLTAQGIDVAKGGYSESSLPATVKVEFIPGTTAVSFSLTGSDQASLPAAVNTYAQVYQEWSEGKSAQASLAVVKQYQSAFDDLDKKLTELQRKQSELLTTHRELNLGAHANAKANARDELQKDMTVAQGRNEEDIDARAAILAALDGVGVVAAHSPGGWTLAAKDGGAFEPRLVEDENVVALPCVRNNTVVGDLRDIESKAADADRKLKDDGLRAEAPDRRAAMLARDAARARRAKAIARTIETELAAQDARMKRYTDNEARLKTLTADATAVEEVLFTYREIENAIESTKLAREQASDKLKKVEGFLHSSDEPDRMAFATRRIVMVTPAANPAVQIAPNVPLISGLTAFAAIAVGLGLVLLFEYFDDTIKSKEDFDRYIKLPFVGFIPRIDEKNAERPDIAADAKTGSAIAEAFRAVRTSILFSRSDKPVRTILVTSAGPGEGKTTVATNLAITLAKHKAPVLLIDADLRRPRVAKAIGVENKIGLTNFLIGELTLDQVVQPTSIEGLFVVTSGPIPPNPAELLHGERLAQLMKTGLERFDRIVIDSPPLIAVSDARIIARCTDGLYVVISMGKTSWRLIQRSLESLTSIGFGAHGAILNNLSAPTGRYGYYYYRDYNYGKTYYVQPTAAPEK
jgi:capsular exopolysaccharide synthesis family protein